MASELDTFEHLKYRIVTDSAGNTFYYNSQNQLHREGGPAVIKANGDEEWRVNGALHRAGGPAVVNQGGRLCLYYYEGKYYTEEQYERI